MAIDPVCKMEADEKEAAATYEYKGKKYYFCAAGCKDRFSKDPEKYLGKGDNTGFTPGHCFLIRAMSFKTTRDRIVARFYTRFPALVKIWAWTHPFVTNADTPWTPLQKELKSARIALVTTAGIHLRSQPPYDMRDKDGDPTFRQIPSSTSADDLMITHNYYDHSDADRDINVVFPLGRLRELELEGMIGGVGPRHFSFMGHILGRHVDALIRQTGPEVAGMLKADGVDAVFLTPA